MKRKIISIAIAVFAAVGLTARNKNSDVIGGNSSNTSNNVSEPQSSFDNTTSSETPSSSAPSRMNEPTAENSTQISIIKEDVNMINISVNGNTFSANLEDNSSAEALKGLLEKGDLTVDMHDYGSFEKVGEIGTTLPRNDTRITTEPGDIILYLGNQITIYYETNSWSFTRLGKIQNVTQSELKSALGSGNATVTFSLA